MTRCVRPSAALRDTSIQPGTASSTHRVAVPRTITSVMFGEYADTHSSVAAGARTVDALPTAIRFIALELNFLLQGFRECSQQKRQSYRLHRRVRPMDPPTKVRRRGSVVGIASVNPLDRPQSVRLCPFVRTCSVAIGRRQY